MRPPIQAMRTAKPRLIHQRTVPSVFSNPSAPRGSSRTKSADVQQSTIASADGPNPPYHDVIAAAPISGAYSGCSLAGHATMTAATAMPAAEATTATR
jgi:hypothetical protein